MLYLLICTLLASSGHVSLGGEQETCTLESDWTRPRQLLEDSRGHADHSSPEAAPAELLAAVVEFFSAYRERDSEAIRRLTMKLPIHLDAPHAEWIDNEVRTVDLFDHRVLFVRRDPSNPEHVRVFSEVATRISERCMVDVMMTRWIKLDDKWVTVPGGGYVQ